MFTHAMCTYSILSLMREFDHCQFTILQLTLLDLQSQTEPGLSHALAETGPNAIVKQLNVHIQENELCNAGMMLQFSCHILEYIFYQLYGLFEKKIAHHNPTLLGAHPAHPYSFYTITRKKNHLKTTSILTLVQVSCMTSNPCPLDLYPVLNPTSVFLDLPPDFNFLETTHLFQRTLFNSSPQILFFVDA